MAKVRNILAASMCIAALSLTACDNAESRAEGHYQSGMELLEDGQVEKASLEFRNAIRLSKTAVEPRVEFGKILINTGDYARAAGTLEEAVEIDPTHLDARKMLTRIMIVANQLTTASCTSMLACARTRTTSRCAACWPRLNFAAAIRKRPAKLQRKFLAKCQPNQRQRKFWALF